ncbi:hypothetical protein [Shewanella sp. SM74]|uniref:hypothetical protein n=1 Tax=Shewanella sp. SM74 TaxID=2912807 RepID=UPI0021DB7EC2|nr:hypothetical protein [Shewanella sp. SM74]MCU8013670.1 hypothetical protein [Shewanella sp. SM74]
MNTAAFHIRTALSNPAFCDFFAESGGGFHPVNHPLKSVEERIQYFCMTDEEFLGATHRYWPKAGSKELGGVIPVLHLVDLLKARNDQLTKLWRYWVAFNNQLPPMSKRVDDLISTVHKNTWQGMQQ